jgi:hypothetical protein
MASGVIAMWHSLRLLKRPGSVVHNRAIFPGFYISCSTLSRNCNHSHVHLKRMPGLVWYQSGPLVHTGISDARVTPIENPICATLLPSPRQSPARLTSLAFQCRVQSLQTWCKILPTRPRASYQDRLRVSDLPGRMSVSGASKARATRQCRFPWQSLAV